MIVDMSNGDILDQPLSDIVYEIDVYGESPEAFDDDVFAIVGPMDEQTIQEQLSVGQVFSQGGVQETTGLYRTFHAIVTIESHFPGYPDPDALTRGLDLIALRNGVKRAAVLAPSNRLGWLGAVARSLIEAVVYLPGSP